MRQETGSSRRAARARTPARNPVDTPIPARASSTVAAARSEGNARRSATPPARWSVGRAAPGFPDVTPTPPTLGSGATPVPVGAGPASVTDSVSGSVAAGSGAAGSGAPASCGASAAGRASSPSGSTGRGTSVAEGPGTSVSSRAAYPPGASDDGGRDDVDESRPKRRFSSPIRSACSAITRRCCTTTDSNSRTRTSNRSTTASNDPESDTSRSSQATASAPVATHHDHQPVEQLRSSYPPIPTSRRR